MTTTLPLESRRLVQPCRANGIAQELPALHRDWIQPREWIAFRAAPTAQQCEDVSGAEELWAERTGFILQDLDFLLGMQYHQFWSQVVYDEALQGHLATLLQGLPRDYDLRLGSTSGATSFLPAVQALLQKLTRKLFLVFLRMATFKESKANFMSPDAFADLIYNHFLFDVPRLMDLCGLFRPCSPSLVERMLDNVFKTQPAYNRDLEHSVVTMVNTLITVTERTEVLTALPSCDTPQQLEALVDLVAFVTDVCVSVSAFLESYPEGAKAFHEQGYEVKMAATYQGVLVVLSKYVGKQHEMKLLTEEMYRALITRLQLSRRACVDTLRQIISVCCVQPALESGKGNDQFAEEFLQIMGGCLSEGPLLVDYNQLHSIQEDFDLLAQSGLEFDPMRMQYINDGVRSQAEEIGANVKKALKKKTSSLGAVPKNKKTSSVSPPPQSFAEAAAPVGGDPTGVALESLISQVKDLLPDLGPGFVDNCLQYYDFDPEKVINAIFEDNLPPHLSELSRDMPREAKPAPQAVVEPPKQVKKKEEEVVQKNRRYNVYDGDAFDINERNEIDSSKVWRGKHSLGSKNANAMLNDKTEIKEMKDKFQGLDIVQDEVYVLPQSSNLLSAGIYDPDYDDEYDDTYDDNAMGEAEPDAKDELLDRRPFVLPRALGGGHVRYVKEQPEQEEEEELNPREAARKKMEFVRNPSDVRDERDRKWQEKNKSRGGRVPNRDVVGQSKGQGQEKQVLINRARKNAGKNKQHRAGADRKAAKMAG